MKPTLFIRTILSSLVAVACLALSGNTAFAGIHLVYPGGDLLPSGDLVPDGSFSDNTVQVNEGGASINNVYGGYSFSDNATGNTVTISGGSATGDVFGGHSVSGNATDNKVTISGGSIGGEVYGGFSDVGNATGNTVTISDGSIEKVVYGGYSWEGDAIGNAVTISGGTNDGGVFGGYSWEGDVTGNKVTISGGKIDGGVYGGYSNEGNATGNTVTISRGTIGEHVCGGYSNEGKATGNTVRISGGVIKGDVLGGVSYSGTGKATGNTVTISGGTIGGEVYGGFSDVGNATGNTVTISGGVIKGNILGGISYSGTATGNTVILKAGASLAETSQVFGGYSDVSGDAFTGNKLVLDGFHGKVAQISNFEYIDIITSGKEKDMLVISGGDATDLSNTKLTITFSGMGRSAEIGDSIYLIRNDSGLITDTATFTENSQNKVKGTAYIYGLQFEADGSSIHAKVTSKKFNDRSKALAEGRVASIAHLNMGGDLIAEQGMAQALRSGKNNGKKINLFAAMSATSSRYDTGSHIDLYGYSALAGASITPPALSSLNAGLFAESGWGHYGSMSDFEDGSVRGAGRSKYYGGGLMAQYDFTKLGAKGLSVDASFRAGKADTSFTSGELPDSRYDLTAPYYGIHAGVNYTRKLTAKLNMANYARFFWTHLDGDSAPIDGSDFRFRTMDSQRIKAGTRFLYEACSCLTPYAGASYEWECSGTSRAIVDGENGIGAPSLRGGTGTGELGAVYQPMADRPFWIDLSVQGHVGERQGISGGVRVRAEF